MRTAVLVPLLGLAACDGWTVPPRVQADALDAVSGCDDPGVWTAPVSKTLEASTELGGDYSCTVQLPIERALFWWTPNDPVDDRLLDNSSVCWRVTEASPGSGWTVGQTFETRRTQGEMNLKGFAQPVTLEGRVLGADNKVAFAIAPMRVELRAPMIVLPDASRVIAVMAADSWAERDAVQLWGQRIPTDEVLDAATIFARAADRPEAFSLHRVGGNIVRRTWSMASGSIEHRDVVIGPGTRGRLTKWGRAAVVDDELVIFDNDDSDNPIVRDRVTLDAAPLELTEDGHYVSLHLPGKLVSYDLYNGGTKTLSVDDGVLMPAFNLSLPLFFDGTKFWQIGRDNAGIRLTDPYPYRPSAEELARIGKPVAEVDSVIIGERGFLATNIWTPAMPVAGPTVATYAELFGDGRLGPVSDNGGYVIVHDDGSAALYAAPFGGYCAPI